MPFITHSSSIIVQSKMKTPSLKEDHISRNPALQILVQLAQTVNTICYIHRLPVLSLLLFLSCTLLNAQQVSDTVPNKTYLITKTLPNYSILNIDSTYSTEKQLLSNTATVFIFFQTTCEHCQQEAKAIVDSSSYLKGVQFVFVSIEGLGVTKQFAKNYKLDRQSNCTVGTDVNGDLLRFFEPTLAPFVVVYNKEGALVGTYAGGASVRKIGEATR